MTTPHFDPNEEYVPVDPTLETVSRMWRIAAAFQSDYDRNLKAWVCRPRPCMTCGTVFQPDPPKGSGVSSVLSVRRCAHCRAVRRARRKGIRLVKGADDA